MVTGRLSLTFLSQVIMNAKICWLLTPIHPSPCMVTSFPATCFLTFSWTSLTASGSIHFVRTLREIFGALGRNSSRNECQTLFSTQESGKPAEAVRQTIYCSKRRQVEWSQGTMAKLSDPETFRAADPSLRLFPAQREVWEIAEAESEGVMLSFEEVHDRLDPSLSSLS